MDNVSFESYSKINLGLKVLNKRSDGFHNISSIFIRTNFSDKLTFKKSKFFHISCNKNNVPIDSNNTISKAYQILNDKFNFKHHYKIHLNKNIPIGSGLGGGSGNAASTLLALNSLLSLNIPSNDMHKIALQIGSDVPFFLKGGIKHVQGRGEIINNFKNNTQFQKLFFLLVCPNFSISTKWAYENLKLKKALKSNDNKYKFSPLSDRVNWKLFENDFELVVKEAYPEIMNIKDTMLNNGAIYSSLSGTGSTVFGIYNEEKFILNTQNELSHYKTYRASPT